MKPVFVKTKNVKNFVSTLANLQNRAKGVPGMALVYGACRHRPVAHIEECLDARAQRLGGVAPSPMVGVDQIAQLYLVIGLFGLV